VSALVAWQREFLAQIARPRRSTDARVADAHVVLHRNNAWFAHVGALEALYPAVHGLVGEECFRALVTRVGEEFAAWIAAEFLDTPREYFGDVAQLEWIAHEVLAAGDSPALDLDQLAATVAEHGDAAVLRMVEHARLMESRWPVRDVWEASAPRRDGPAGAVPEDVDLDAGPQRLRIQRVDGELRIALHSPGEFALMQACGRGEPLGAALAHAASVDPAFDASRALLAMARAGVFARRFN
jgi:hypothetical protein